MTEKIDSPSGIVLKNPSAHPSPVVESVDSTSLMQSLSKQRSYESIKYMLNWYYDFHDPEMKQQYINFCATRCSSGTLMFGAMVVIIFIIFPVQAANLISDLTMLSPAKHGNPHVYLARLVTSSIEVVNILIACILGVIVYLKHTTYLPLKKFLPYFELKKVEFGEKVSYGRRLLRWILKQKEVIFVMNVQMYLSILFLRRVYELVCSPPSNSIASLFGSGECYGGLARTETILVSTCMMVTIPLIFGIVLPDTDISIIWLNLLSSAVLAIGSALITGLSNAVAMILVWLWLSSFMMLDIHIRNILTFFTTTDLHEALLEVRRMEEETRANEMRSMIANVAHDLKTPLSSFITGIDYIQHIMDEIATRFYPSISPMVVCRREDDVNDKQTKENIEAIQGCLSNIRNTNAFMLMIINRCIDYTKASKGMKLIPRYENIVYMDAIQIPLNCMKNIQSRVQIHVQENTKDTLFSKIITDRQWLIENLLCLLSNAVKYSNKGRVDLRIQILSLYNLQKLFGVTQMVYDQNDSPSELPFPENVSSNSGNSSERVVGNANGNTPSPKSPKSTIARNKIKPTNSSSPRNLRKAAQTWDSKKTLVLEERNFLVFEVEDSGIGVSEEKKESLYIPRQQSSRLNGGTGLGLYCLAQRIEALQGYHGLASRKDGVSGALFWFALPILSIDDCFFGENNNNSISIATALMRELTPEVAINTVTSTEIFRQSIRLSGEDEPIQDGKVSTFLNNDFSPISQHTKHNTKTSTKSNIEVSTAGLTATTTTTCNVVVDIEERRKPSSPKGSSPKSPKSPPKIAPTPAVECLDILVVDDSPAIVKMISMMLTRLKHRVSSADHGQEACDVVQEKWKTEKKQFNVILMDLQMPIMDGLEATRQLRRYERQEEGFGHQLVVGMSANSDHDTSVDALESGMDYFLTKPFAIQKFMEVVREYRQPTSTI